MGKRQGGLTEIVDLAIKIPQQITGGLRFIGGKTDKSGATVSLMNAKQFEMRVSDAFRRLGFEVTQYVGSANSGADLLLVRDGARHLVRCEQWRAQAIGADLIRALAAVMSRDGAQVGYVVSPGRFAREARELARLSHIELFDEKNIESLIGT
jgi:HJR/Mrr/RecB family endonuclease